MYEIKPIETYYNGYRFRSKLEAKWAVFFDKVGIPYQYEPEGFDLGNSVWYLPDFYLPWFDAYVEIKPPDTDNEARENINNALKKLRNLFLGSTHAVLLCAGDPLDNFMLTWACDITDSSAGGPNLFSARFLEGIECYFHGDKHVTGGSGKHTIILAIGGKDDKYREYCCSDFSEIKSSCSFSSIFNYRSNLNSEREFARQYRFDKKGGKTQ